MDYLEDEKKEESKDIEERVSLRSTLKKLMQEKKFTDIILVCNGGEIEAHRVILSAESPYFETMLTSDFKETLTKTIDFSHIDLNIMQKIIDFMYLHTLSDVSDEGIEGLIKMFQVSHLFEVKDLIDRCWELIMKQINTDNCLKIWNLVDLHGCGSDISRILNYVLLNLRDIINNDEFLNLSSSQMLNIFGTINKKNIPVLDCVLEKILEWSVINTDQKEVVQDFLFGMNFELISKEYMSSVLESGNSLFADNLCKKFFQLQILPNLKLKIQIETLFFNQMFVQKIEENLSLNFFLFGYCKNESEQTSSIQNQLIWRVFDCETKTLKVIKNLIPVDAISIFPMQYCSDIYFFKSELLYPYLIGGKRSVYFSTFFHYDWIKNKITELPSLIKKVAHPQVCISRKNIYVIETDTYEIMIQYFCVYEQKWRVIECSHSNRPKVLACVSHQRILYFLCDDASNFSLYTLGNSSYPSNDEIFEFHSASPIHHFRDKYDFRDILHKNSMFVFQNKIFIVTTNTYHWYIFNISTKIWDISKPNYVLDMVKSCRIFPVDDKYIMLYNEENQKLFQYHEQQNDFTEIMTIEGTFRNDEASQIEYISKGIMIYKNNFSI